MASVANVFFGGPDDLVIQEPFVGIDQNDLDKLLNEETDVKTPQDQDNTTVGLPNFITKSSVTETSVVILAKCPRCDFHFDFVSDRYDLTVPAHPSEGITPCIGSGSKGVYVTSDMTAQTWREAMTAYREALRKEEKGGKQHAHGRC